MYREFLRLVNMTSSEIRQWMGDERRHDASYASTLRELPLLARMKALPPGRWTPAMWRKARRAIAFIKRHEAQARTDGMTYRRAVALRNWGRRASLRKTSHRTSRRR